MSETTENQKGRTLNYEHFDLINFKASNSGISAVYYNLLDRDTKQKRDCDRVPHPDLFEALNALRTYFLNKTGFSEGFDFAREHLRDNAEALELAINGYGKLIERTKITGLTYNGDEVNEGVSIIGYVKYPGGSGTGLSSKKIGFGKSKLGYEEEVEDRCELIKQEVYNYLFLGKQAQQEIDAEPDLFDQDDE